MADHSVLRDKNLTAAGVTAAPFRRGRQKTPVSDAAGITYGELWRFHDSMPGPNWYVTFVSNHMSLARFKAAKRVDDSPEPVPLGTLTDSGERVLSPDEETAQAVVTGIRSRSGDVGSLIRPMVENLLVPGELYQVAVPRDQVEEVDRETGERSMPDDIPPDVAGGGAPSPDDLLWFEIYSTDECRVKKGPKDPATGEPRWIVELNDKLGGTKWEQQSPHTVAHRIWQRHPRHSTMVTSPFRAAYRTLCQLARLDDLVDTAIESRLLGRGIFLVPAGTQPDIPDWLEDYDGETFFDRLFDAMTEAIDDRDMAAAAAPITVEVPKDSIEAFRHLEFPLTIDEFFEEVRTRLRGDLAEAWNVPTSQLSEDGIGDLNHWSQWAEQESTVRTTWKPMAELIAAAWTELILHPLLRDAGVTDWHTYVVWYDLGELMQRPARVEEAGAFHDLMLISDEAALAAGGFDESDAPDEDEVVRRMLIKLTEQAPSAMPAVLEYLGYTEAAAAIRGEISAPESAPPTGPTPPDMPADGPPETDPTDMQASGVVAAAVRSEAVRWAVAHERDRMGRRLRNLVQKDPVLRELFDGEQPVDFLAALGRRRVEAVIPGQSVEAFIQPGAFDELARRAAALGTDRESLVAEARAELLNGVFDPWPSHTSTSTR